MMRTAIVALGLLGAAAAHAGPPTAARCDAGRPPQPATLRAITDIDWCSLDGVAWKGTLVDGHSEVHLYSDLHQVHDTIATRLVSVDYGDIDGDRRPEAVVVLETTTWIGGNAEGSHSSDLRVFSVRGGKLVRGASLPIGTPVTDLQIRRGVIETVSGPDAARWRHRWQRRTRTFTSAAVAP